MCGAGRAGKALISGAVGLFIGLLAGYLRWFDGIVMRIMDGLMSNMLGDGLRDPLDPAHAQAAVTARREVIRPVNDIAIISRV